MVVFILKSIVALSASFFALFLFKDKKTALAQKDYKSNFFVSSLIGGVAYFLDTLGIGSFAVSTALLRLFNEVPSRLIPGTLNVTGVIPSSLSAFIFVSIIDVDYITLICMVAASAIGAWSGASFVSKLSEQKIRISMSIALFLTASYMLSKQLHLIPAMSALDLTIGLTGQKLVIATVASFFIGSLNCIGIGNFAPTLALTSWLGMSAQAVFPIMMLGSAFNSVCAAIGFIKAGQYERRSCIAMISLAVVGVLAAAYIVKSLPLETFTWIVVGIIYYTSFYIFLETRMAIKKRNEEEEAKAWKPVTSA